MDNTHFLSKKSLSNFQGRDPIQVHRYGLAVGFNMIPSQCTAIEFNASLICPANSSR